MVNSTFTKAGMEQHVISMEEVHTVHSRKVERKEAGETSRGHDQPVIGAIQNLSITIHDEGRTSSEEANFKKLKEARDKWQNEKTTEPKIQKVMLVHFNKNKIVFLLI